MRGGPEREVATQVYQISVQIAERVFSTRSVEFIEALKESAQQLESIHQEKGKPEYSKWNQCAAIPDDNASTQARYKFTQALDLLKALDMRKTILSAEVLMSLAKLTKIPDDKFTTM